MTLSRAKAKLLARLGRRKGREGESLFLAEGIRTAREALAARAAVSFGVVSPRVSALAGGSALVTALEAAGVELLRVGDEELAAYSDTAAPQGVLLVCSRPAAALDDLPLRAAGAGAGLRLLVLDGVQDPGNAGTLLRAAGAFGLSGAVFLDGSVDPFNPRVVRASAGAVFHVPVVRERWGRFGPWLGEQGVRCLAADAAGEDVACAEHVAPWALVIGSEGAGVRADVLRDSTGLISVPMQGGAESLNAAMAGSILLYVLTRGQ